MENWPLWDGFTFPTTFRVCQLTKEEWPKWSFFEQIAAKGFEGYFCWFLGLFLTFLSDSSAFSYLLSHSYLIMSILISYFVQKYHFQVENYNWQTKNLTRFGFYLITPCQNLTLSQNQGVFRNLHILSFPEIGNMTIFVLVIAEKFAIEASVESFGTVLSIF